MKAANVADLNAVPDFEEIRIENTNLCGYRCHFCPREAMTRIKGIMPLADLAVVLERVGQHRGRVDLHGFGEPLLDPQLPERVRLVRGCWPESRPTVYSTLGVPVAGEYFDRLLGAGLGELEVSFYGHDADSYAAAHGVRRYELALANLERLAAAASAHPGFALVLRDPPRAVHAGQVSAEADPIAEFQKKWSQRGLRIVGRELHNFGGGRRYNPAGTAICSVVWGYRKRVLQVTWDLKVIPCCFDFNASISLGDLRLQSLGEIYSSSFYRAFIEAHIAGRLDDYAACAACERCDRA